MDELENSGRLPGELRTAKRLVKICPARTYPAQTRVEYTYYGPCLVCGKDMQYGDMPYRFSTEIAAQNWLLSEFSPQRRNVHLRFLDGRLKPD